jgi:hypothetical protein
VTEGKVMEIEVAEEILIRGSAWLTNCKKTSQSMVRSTEYRLIIGGRAEDDRQEKADLLMYM